MTDPSVGVDREPVVRVSTLELFFDLVFVFTVTQLTALLAGHPTWSGAGRVVVLLLMIWWMYDGYAWLTNHLAPTDHVRRGLLLLGMFGFLMIALAVPGAYAGSGWVFGAGYFLVNLIHSGLLFRVAPTAMRHLFGLNLLSAALVLGGGIVTEPWRTWLWLAAIAVMAASPYLHPLSEWSISSAHFVERHGLIVIIALGESVVAIGAGAAGLELTPARLGVAGLGLLLSFLLWWLYFGGDDVKAEHALDSVPSARRGRTALHAFGWAHVPLLLGVVVFAAGVKKAVLYAGGHLYPAYALLLAGGIAVFLLGDVLFRWVLCIGRRRYRLLGALAVLATIPLGLVSTLAQLATLAALLATVITIESRPPHPSPR
ncbi:low temperature requirement protein A [Catellatospora tritici]|uniref:low temperature requirement protein A n=1 Tax=Catellatospora tritici TaxID=2851566 RepID=UPI001C2D13E7|nr:low temperature requirement protein A [Catellatospora tritici]MBV1848563.1 low temperature requirement protein A [Catellatospora tritici]MBV1851417.1 low temperature requirement protein A [Catellatospora tritici]